MSSPESETRTRILAETMRLMEERSGKDVTISEIAKAAHLSRQAVYLHFESRTALLIATVRYADQIYGLEQRLKPLLSAASGVEALQRYVEFWGNYIPCIYGLARALLAQRSQDEAAASAWNDRMATLYQECRRIIQHLKQENMLRPEWEVDEATDLFYSLFSLNVWESLTIERGKSIDQYVSWMQAILMRTFTNTV